MRKHVAADFCLRLLNELAVRGHAPPGVRLGELVGNKRVGVETGQGDKLITTSVRRCVLKHYSAATKAGRTCI